MAAIDDATALYLGHKGSAATPWVDQSGNGHDAAFFGTPTWVPEGADSHFVLDSGDGFTIPDADAFDWDNTGNDASITAAFLMEWAATPSANQFLISHGDPQGSNPGWAVRLNAVNTMRQQASDGTTTRNFTTAGGITAVTRHLIVQRFDGAGTVSTKAGVSDIDATNEVSSNNFYNAIADTTNTDALKIGRNLADGNPLVDVTLYAAAYWDRAILDAEVAGLEAEFLSLAYPPFPQRPNRRVRM